MLLILRVDRRLEWIEIARVLAKDEGPEDDASLKREAARLRRRFQTGYGTWRSAKGLVG